MISVRWIIRVGLVAALAVVGVVARSLVGQEGQAPQLVFETAAGTFTVLTFPLDAPKSVAQIVDLVKKGFYDGQRIHRAVPGFVVQFGDPQSRDLTQRSRWGRGPGAGSGRAIGFAEMSETLKHGPGTVGLAHMGDPAHADSQLYVALDRRKDLDGRYAVIGQVVAGLEVTARLKVGDLIGRAYLAAP